MKYGTMQLESFRSDGFCWLWRSCEIRDYAAIFVINIFSVSCGGLVKYGTMQPIPSLPVYLFGCGGLVKYGTMQLCSYDHDDWFRCGGLVKYGTMQPTTFVRKDDLELWRSCEIRDYAAQCGQVHLFSSLWRSCEIRDYAA